MQTPAQKLCGLVGKKYLVFTERGNSAIKLALQAVRMMGKKKVLIQDQGGWLTYSQFIEKLGMEKIELKTDYGIVAPESLAGHQGCVLLINSMPGYAALQDMEEVADACRKNSIFLLNDASGSIGTGDAEFGDVIIGSFGHAKPVDMGHGGFIATDDERIYREVCGLNMFIPDSGFLDALGEKLGALSGRLSFFELRRQEVIEDLKHCGIIHPHGGGINVIVKFNNELQKKEILSYCKEQGLECTMCPRYIRVDAPAVSIEIKRLQENHDVEIGEEYDEADDDVD